jgi:hypothetical protein
MYQIEGIIGNARILFNTILAFIKQYYIRVILNLLIGICNIVTYKD